MFIHYVLQRPGTAPTLSRKGCPITKKKQQNYNLKNSSIKQRSIFIVYSLYITPNVGTPILDHGREDPR